MISTLVPVTEEPAIDHPMESNDSSSIGLNHQFPLCWLLSKSNPQENPDNRPLCLPPCLLTRTWPGTLLVGGVLIITCTDGSKVEVYLRLRRHLYSKQIGHIPNTYLEARMKPVPKKPKVATSGLRPQENCKSGKQKERAVWWKL